MTNVLHYQGILILNTNVTVHYTGEGVHAMERAAKTCIKQNKYYREF